MIATIDKAGRLVIPAQIREQAGFAPGTEVEVEVDEIGVRLVRRVRGPELVRVGKLLIARPTVPPEERPAIDLEAVIEAERDRWP